MALLAAPVPGYIHRKGTRPAGSTEFYVVRTMADHQAAKQGNGVDIGNAKCGAPVLAMADGTVYSRYIQNTPGKIGHGSLIMRVRYADGRTSGNAHMSAFSVAKLAAVKRGQQIGVLGGSGGFPCHLHYDLREASGAPIDAETQLEQNHNLQLNNVTGVNLREGPDTSAPIWAVARTDGVWRLNVNVCASNVILARRPTATATADGYEWMPILLPVSAAPLWVARPFIHFV